jgi:hypothetical protein
MNWFRHMRAYALGMLEFRSDFTTHCGWPFAYTYDMGRDMAHRLTLRRFEQ